MEMSRFIIEFGDRLDGHFREKAFTQNPEQARVQLRFTTSQGGGCFPSGVSGMRVYGEVVMVLLYCGSLFLLF